MADREANAARERCTFAWDIRDLYAPENRFNLAVAGFVTTRPARKDLEDQAQRLHRTLLDESLRGHLPEGLRDGVLIPARLDLSKRARKQLEELEELTETREVDRETFAGPRDVPTASDVPAARLTGNDDIREDDEAEDFALLHAVFPDLTERRRLLRRERQTHRVAFHLKLLYDWLPTSLRWLLWRPDLVPDGKCRRCNLVEETRMHLRECSQVNVLSRERFGAAFCSAVVRVSRRRVRAQRWLDGLASSAADLLSLDWVYLGVIPDAQVLALASVSSLSEGRARLTILSGLVAAREVFLSEVWRPRCKETLAWERAHGITTARKRSRPSTTGRAAAAVIPNNGIAQPRLDGDAHGFLPLGGFHPTADDPPEGAEPPPPQPENMLASTPRPIHQAVDKIKERWKMTGRSVLDAAYGSWRICLLSG
jgi:hypothetical protein